MASREAVERAEKILSRMKADNMFGTAGRRNDDAVNFCICSNIVNAGKEPNVVFRAEFTHLDDIDYNKMIDHILRIEPYADSWFAVGHEEQAFEKAININKWEQ